VETTYGEVTGHIRVFPGGDSYMDYDRGVEFLLYKGNDVTEPMSDAACYNGAGF
jgi:hypothetical protein